MHGYLLYKYFSNITYKSPRDFDKLQILIQQFRASTRVWICILTSPWVKTFAAGLGGHTLKSKETRLL